MVQCSVLGCKNRRKCDETMLSFHRFPKTRLQQEIWIKACGRESWTPGTSAVICSEHFENVSFIITAKRKYLKPESNPSLHIHLEDDMENHVKFKLVGGRLKLKKGVLPHKFECQKIEKKKIDRPGFKKRQDKVNRGKCDNEMVHSEKKSTFKNILKENINNEEQLQLDNESASTSMIASIPSVPASCDDDDDSDDESPGGHSDDSSMDSNSSRTSRKDSETTTLTHSSGDAHEGFTCNACSGSIVGFRYTCVQCANYDLCASCESRGEHSLHYVLRIPRLAPHDEVASMLSKIRMHLLYGFDTEEAEQETDDRVVPALSEEPIKAELKEELPDPLEHEDAFQPDDNYAEPEYTRDSTSKEQRVALVPDTRSIITETEQNYAIRNNLAKVTETEPKTTKHGNIVIEPSHGSRFKIYVEPSQESETTKRKNTTEPEHGPEKHMKMYFEEQSRAIETMMEISADTAGQSTDGASELLQEIKTEEKDEGSFEVFSHTSKKILEVAKPGPDTEKYMAATTSKKKVKQNYNVHK